MLGVPAVFEPSGGDKKNNNRKRVVASYTNDDIPFDSLPESCPQRGWQVCHDDPQEFERPLRHPPLGPPSPAGRGGYW